MSEPKTVRSLLLWHVHGSWTEAFVAGRHNYVIPLNADQDANGRGICGRNTTLRRSRMFGVRGPRGMGDAPW